MSDTAGHNDTPASAEPHCSAVLALWDHGEHYCDVPITVAVCPECGSQLIAQSESWDATGAPLQDGLSVSCEDEDDAIQAWEENDEDKRNWREVMHRWWQGEWQPVIDRVRDWCGAVK